ncbi:MAG TPA: nucleoside-diphosphate kinase [Syntrophomonas sp.]|nr:nucleoside-diphosphate kinase [Syntrophomonas sp.]
MGIWKTIRQKKRKTSQTVPVKPGHRKGQTGLTEQTFVMVKPDGVQRGLVGEIIRRLESKGFKLAAMKFMLIDRNLAQKHYAEHADKGFFQELIAFITSGPVVAMVWEGEEAIASIRKLMGSTNPREAAPGTIRGDLAIATNFNLIHGSDSTAAAKREIKLFFDPREFCDYSRNLDSWIK